MTYVWLVIILAAAVGGCVQAHRHTRRDLEKASSKAGWVYFITAPGQPDAPIKVGMSSKDPTEQRLTDLRTMSPFPLKIIAKMYVGNRFECESAIHEHLAPHRLHGEWFDRDATLAFIDHLQGHG